MKLPNKLLHYGKSILVPPLLLAALVSTVSAQPLARYSASLPPPLSTFPPEPVSATASVSPSAVGSCPTPSFEEQVVEIVNQERLANGALAPLKQETLLDNSSETHSANMANRDFFAHCDPDTDTLPWDRMQAAGYSYNAAAENIAAGYSTPASVMAGWMNSSGHRANILSTNYRELGVGYFFQSSDASNVRTDANGDCTPDGTTGALRHYWTQNFGRRNNVYPVIINREAIETTSRNVQLYLYGAGWASEMRVQNAGGAWSSWQAFSSTLAWQLGTGNGVKTISVELRNGATVRSASDSICLNETNPSGSGIYDDGFEDS